MDSIILRLINRPKRQSASSLRLASISATIDQISIYDLPICYPKFTPNESTKSALLRCKCGAEVKYLYSAISRDDRLCLRCFDEKYYPKKPRGETYLEIFRRIIKK